MWFYKYYFLSNYLINHSLYLDLLFIFKPPKGSPCLTEPQKPARGKMILSADIAESTENITLGQNK